MASYGKEHPMGEYSMEERSMETNYKEENDMGENCAQNSAAGETYAGGKDKIGVLVESCADIPAELIEEYHIFVLPIAIECLDGQYRDGVDITAEDIYEKLKTELPKSSSPLGSDIEDVFQEMKRQGYTKAVAISLSGGLSGTVNHLRMAAGEFSDLEIQVFDSRQASIGIGVIALQAAQEIRKGISFEALLERIPRLIENTRVFFSIDTLEYLQKGGRIGKVTAMAGAMLQIKPILSFDEDGEIYTAAKVRGRKQVESRLLKLVEELSGEGRPYNLVVADGGAPREREELEAKLVQSLPDYANLYRARIGAALSIYLGSGLLGAGIQFLD